MENTTKKAIAAGKMLSATANKLRIPILFAVLLIPLPMFFGLWEALEREVGLDAFLAFCCAFAATVTTTVVLLRYVKASPPNQPEMSEKAALLHSKTQAIHALNLQRYLFGAVLACLGIYIAYQAQQAIVFASGGSEYGADIFAANQRIEMLQADLSDALKGPDTDKSDSTAAVVLSDTELALRQLVVEELKNQIATERVQLNELYAHQQATQDSISPAFLFSYFSDFFVRVATLAVSISFFSILLGQYRRIEVRIAQYTAIKSALLLELGKWNAEALKQNAPTMLVLENAPKSAPDDTEIALPKSVIENVVGAITNLGLTEMVNGRGTTGKNNGAAGAQQK
ncbi:hypothetical protein GG681_08155 [Epibacterium sp. SM1969]|uniref:Uncharacterized protein n=1 Tax=Tritonibacter aquimaris TaxID=2663379 RepID=A0A844AW57_9RHOB|nr:hypothetical protein [Tritonibacter aquimaris]MQY42614.1 hypothetical protein [Tritonibacter aquimaris]